MSETLTPDPSPASGRGGPLTPVLEPPGGTIVQSWAAPPAPTASLGDVAATEYQSQLLNRWVGAQDVARERAVEDRNRAVKQATGQDLENPMRDGYLPEALQRAGLAGQTPPDLNGMSLADLGLPASDAGAVRQAQTAIYQEKLADLAQRFPGRVDAGPIQSAAEQLATASVKKAQDTYQASGGGVLPFLASFAGGAGVMLRDPVQLGALFFGGGEATVFKSVAGQMLETFLRQGAVNAGVQALEEPAVQAWAAKRGLDSGLKPALEDVADAFVFGGALGTAAHALPIGLRAAADRLRASPKAALDLADRVEAKSPETAAALRSVAADREAAGPPPAGVAGEAAPVDVAPALREAVRAMEHPDAPLPEAVITPEEYGRRIRIRAEQIDPATFRAADELDNRIAAARSQIEELRGAEPQPVTAGQDRIESLQAQLDAITGKRRSSPRAQNLRDQIAALQETQDRMGAQASDATDSRMQALRENLNDLVNSRGRLGPQVYAATQAATREAEAMGFRPGDLSPLDPADRRAASAATRAEALPEASARLLGNDGPPPARTLEVPREPPPSPAPREKVSPQATDEGKPAEGKPAESGVAPPHPAAAPPPSPASGRGGLPEGGDRLAGLFEPGDPLGQVPIAGRDGKVSLVDRAAIGAEAERHGWLGDLIGNCVL